MSKLVVHQPKGNNMQTYSEWYQEQVENGRPFNELTTEEWRADQFEAAYSRLGDESE